MDSELTSSANINDDAYNDFLKDYLWRYFEFHADQRLKTFNFFIIFASLLSAGMVNSLGNKNEFPALGSLLGISLMGLSFIFWKLDERVKFLIKHSEDFLKRFEENILLERGAPSKNLIGVFLEEERHTNDLKKKKNRWCAKFPPTGATQFPQWDPPNFLNGSQSIS